MALLDRIRTYFAHHIKRIGTPILYSVLLLYYAFRNGDTPGWAKHVITGALAYFLSPLDGIPDLAPLLGFTDDLSVLSFALVTVACYITPEVRIKAKSELSTWLPAVDTKALIAVDKML